MLKHESTLGVHVGVVNYNHLEISLVGLHSFFISKLYALKVMHEMHNWIEMHDLCSYHKRSMSLVIPERNARREIG